MRFAGRSIVVVLVIPVVLLARLVSVGLPIGLMRRYRSFSPGVVKILTWGGLRGGVALALALALPEELPERDLFIAMTAGVVLGTLLINATTLPFLLHFLHLDEPRRSDDEPFTERHQKIAASAQAAQTSTGWATDAQTLPRMASR